MVTTTLDCPPQTANTVVRVVGWKGRDPVQETLTEWPDAPFVAQNWETDEDTLAMVILNALQYPVWKRVWDNPEDSVYDDYLGLL